MTKMGICLFADGYSITDFVAPKSKYPDVDSFIDACKGEFDWLYGEDIFTAEKVKEGYCRWYPVAPEGVDIEGGCYGFSRAGRGSFAVWYISVRIKYM